ncbi:MAG TPA: ABC transporter permease [Candidatus Polarisedimenticolia bacterium]|nr:ABC transporter permease [Candidatus Polarisedimenticolia bacterium]
MALLRRLSALLRNLFRRPRVERDLHDEMNDYLEGLVRERVEAGATPEEARRVALLEMGGPEQVKEAVRDVRAGAWIEAFFQDLRFGARILRKSPGFTFLAILTLALGIGANTAVFSVVNTVLLRPLPFPGSERLVTFWQSYPQRGLATWRMSQANFLAYRQEMRSFEQLAAYNRTGYNASGAGEPARLDAMSVSANFFDVLQVRPEFGRAFRTGEDAPGRRALCVLSHAQWRRQFGSDPGVIGKALILDNVPTEIVGVMPADFRWPGPPVDVWVPLDLSPERTSPFNLIGLARLRPGVQAARAEAEATHLLKVRGANDQSFIGSNAVAKPDSDLHAVVTPLHDTVSGASRTPLLVLLGAVALVLLIACANVANLLLGRAAVRQREIAMRFALGATRARVVRQLMTECLLLGALGGAAGLALAGWGLELLAGLPLGIPRLGEVRLDPGVLAFTAGVGLLATLLFGLLPALRIGRLGSRNEWHGEGRGTSSAGTRATHGALVGVQFALSLILLVGTGLLLKSFHRLTAIEPGFETEKVLTMRLYVPPQHPDGYRNPFAPAQGAEGEHALAFYRSVEERLRSLPGITAAGLVDGLPFTGDLNSDGTVIEGHEPEPGTDSTITPLLTVGPGYFRALGIPVLRGRDFADTDRIGSQPVAVVDEAMAKRWGGADPVGGRIRYGWNEEPDAWMTIVGVVANVRDITITAGQEPDPHLYLPLGQGPQRRMGLVVRTAGDPAATAGAIRAAIRGIDPGVPPFDVQTLSQNLDSSLARERFTNILLSLFAAVSLLLAAAGIYGVMSLEVSSRLKEMAIRIALGARPREVFALVLRRGTLLAVAGLGVGFLGALALTRFLKNLLFEVGTTDPATYSMVVVVLVSVAILACALPARRATRVDPIESLRRE